MNSHGVLNLSYLIMSMFFFPAVPPKSESSCKKSHLTNYSFAIGYCKPLHGRDQLMHGVPCGLQCLKRELKYFLELLHIPQDQTSGICQF